MTNGTTQPIPREGLLVLIVEDEFLIAFDMQMMLEEAGHSVMGPVGTVTEALRLLEDHRPDAATLDLNLRGQRVVPVAQRLQSLSIPFVLASAYMTRDYDDGGVFHDAENIGKPIQKRRLLDALQRVTGTA
ncbi:response regulator [Cereibacter azotoformans]|uniref:Response regulatory domain-containing protein n=1 Tax=Cereibacter sphaeroides (strain ATCC 17025 / ATH 2.4.3) TaxID=349102 RepID=A4WXV4_CERS5|nr:response regulator [Cereibacter azotoformans]ULB11672.1 response regulator [Cereibacter azotoformans]